MEIEDFNAPDLPLGLFKFLMDKQFREAVPTLPLRPWGLLLKRTYAIL